MIELDNGDLVFDEWAGHMLLRLDQREQRIECSRAPRTAQRQMLKDPTHSRPGSDYSVGWSEILRDATTWWNPSPAGSLASI
jgi:hypothetical protein